tara:strand:- start:714 stop:911 length:198 start_codon:yes stop_codon:yes gene_type:complete
MKIGEAVQKASIDNGIGGVVAMAEHCGLSYERTVRVWKGDHSAKIADVITVLGSVGLRLKIESEG